MVNEFQGPFSVLPSFPIANLVKGGFSPMNASPYLPGHHADAYLSMVKEFQLHTSAIHYSSVGLEISCVASVITG